MNVVSPSQNTLLCKHKALQCVTVYHTLAITFAPRGATAKLAKIHLSFFAISWIEYSFLPSILATSAYDFFFPY